MNFVDHSVAVGIVGLRAPLAAPPGGRLGGIGETRDMAGTLDLLDHEPPAGRPRVQLRLLLAGELPESWIPPAGILELRTRVRLRKTLIDQRTAWLQRLRAQLFHQGVPPGLKPCTAAVELCLRMVDQLERELVPIDRALRAFARRQPGCRALTGQLYGVGTRRRSSPNWAMRAASVAPMTPSVTAASRSRLAVRPQTRRRPPLASRPSASSLGLV
jgi:hypothetical protein